MRLLQILADILEIRGQIQEVYPIIVNNPELNEEMEEEVGDQIALPFSRWHYKEMIIDLIMITYWLQCIFEPACCKCKKHVLYLWSLWKEFIKEIYNDKNIKAKI